jgi:GH24 family phage-related lysozyme (muramidase)
MARYDLGDPLMSFIGNWEAFRAKPYWDHGQWSVGFGTRAHGPNDVVDMAEATQRLRNEVGYSQSLVNQRFPNLPQGWKDALTSLTYNSGTKWMDGGLGKALSSGDYDAAKRAFLGINKSQGQYMEGLAQRRADELNTFADGNAQPQQAIQLAQSMKRNPVDQLGTVPMNSDASAPAPSTPDAPTQTADASAGSSTPSFGSLSGDLSAIGKAFQQPQAKLQMLPPPQIQYPQPPGLMQARALAMAMAMRPIASTSETMGTTV